MSTFLKLRQLWSHKTADWTGPQEGQKAKRLDGIEGRMNRLTKDDKDATRQLTWVASRLNLTKKELILVASWMRGEPDHFEIQIEIRYSDLV